MLYRVIAVPPGMRKVESGMIEEPSQDCPLWVKSWMNILPEKIEQIGSGCQCQHPWFSWSRSTASNHPLCRASPY
jgi:hypothetical protein